MNQLALLDDGPRARQSDSSCFETDAWRKALDGKVTRKDGYVMLRMPEHPRANSWGYVRYHIVVAELAMGGNLPPGAEVHHANGDRSDNRRTNLVICPDRRYHYLLHQRANAFISCGLANWKKCPYCKQYGDPADMYDPGIPGRQAVHRQCRAAFERVRRATKQLDRGAHDSASV